MKYFEIRESNLTLSEVSMREQGHGKCQSVRSLDKKRTIISRGKSDNFVNANVHLNRKVFIQLCYQIANPNHSEKTLTREQ